MSEGKNMNLVFRRIGMDEFEQVKELFYSVFTAEPWNDDWSDEEQLKLYLRDLMAQQNSLTFGLFEDGCLTGVSMGLIKHWYTGTEYCIDELCIRRDRQGKGLGSRFLHEIEEGIRTLGLTQIFLQTDTFAPAYLFYQKNGYQELQGHVSFSKLIKKEAGE